MATCQCGTQLPGRRQKCEECKARPGKAVLQAAISPMTPDGLHDRGRALWSVLGQQLDTVAGQVALEACRTADRLDELDRIIAGKGVLNLMRFRVGSDWADDLVRSVDITVTFDGVMSEVRQQAALFAKLLGEVDAPPVELPTPKVSNPLDELKKRRERKS